MTQQLDAAQPERRPPPRRTRTSSALKQQIDAYAKDARPGGQAPDDRRAAAGSSSGCSPTTCSTTAAARRSTRPRARCSTASATLLRERLHPPDRRRGPHRRPADRERRSSRPTGSCRPPAPPPSSDSRSATTSDAGRLAASGYGAQHPIATNATADGRARNRRVEIVLTRIPHAARHGGNPERMEAHPMVKKIVLIVARAARPRRRLQVRPGQAGAAGAEAQGRRARSTCCRRSSSSTSTDGRFAKLSVGLVLDHDAARRSRPAATRRATPPEGYGTMPQEAVVRDIVTDALTDANGDELDRARAAARSSRRRSSRRSRSRPM